MRRTSSAIGIVFVLVVVALLPGPTDGGSRSGAVAPEVPRSSAASDPADPGPIEGTLQALCAVLFGSVPEDCTTQYDGRSHGDAANRCEAANKVLPVNDSDRSSYSALLLPGEDEVDDFLIPGDDKGGVIEILLRAQPALPDDGSAATGVSALPRFAVTVFAKEPGALCLEPVGQAEQVGRGIHLQFVARPYVDHVVAVSLAKGMTATPSPVSTAPGPVAPFPGLEAEARAASCHGACVGALNQAFGYQMHATGP